MEVLNINVGILGHVDSGKTSLVKALSTVLSTASLDKSPQSRERGITLDLGFSAFTVPIPDHLLKSNYSLLQFTLVDCPGHASLIRTIIGGAQIMDMMLLVIDVTKGMQAQTVECVVIGEAVMAKTNGADVIIVLNKVDLVPKAERKLKIDQAKKEIMAQLGRTKLSNASIVSCAAAVGGERGATSTTRPERHAKGKAERGGRHRPETVVRRNFGMPEDMDTAEAVPNDQTATAGVSAVVEELTRRARVPDRRISAPFYFAFDHCFSTRGVGTILTGTVLAGEVKVNQFVELPALRLQKKVKSMQMFRKPVTIARAGDRVGLCLATLDAKLLERGVVAAPGSVRPVTAAIALVRRVPAFGGRCRSGAFCHVSLGHTTAMATATFFGAKELKKGWRALINADVGHHATGDTGWEEEAWSLDDMANLPFPWGAEFAQQQELLGWISPEGSIHMSPEQFHDETSPLQYCLLSFHTPVMAPPSSVVLGSRLDTTVSDAGNATCAAASGGDVGCAGEGHCRIAFHGRLVSGIIDDDKYKPPGGASAGLVFGREAGQLKLFNEKLKTGVVFRVGEDSGRVEGKSQGKAVEVFGKDLFKKETNMMPFVGMLLHTEGGVVGRIESAFGKAGRFRARFPPETSVHVGDKLLLKFRKYVRDPSKGMDQSYLQNILKGGQLQQGKLTEDARTSEGDSPLPPALLKTPPASGESEQPPLRKGRVDSVKYSELEDEAACVAITSGLFSQEEDIRAFAKQGMAALTKAGVEGILLGPFGKAGKCKLGFARGALVQVGDHVFVSR